jgi:hypothetical protein
VPIIWFVGSIMVAVLLKPAPPSKHKRWMMAFLVLTPLALVLFIAVMAGYGIGGVPSYPSYSWHADLRPPIWSRSATGSRTRISR